MILRHRRDWLETAAVVVAALTGNWLGARAHQAMTGRTAHGIVYAGVDDRGRALTSFPVSANFYPALLCAGLGRPRWLYALLAGFLVSLAAGDALQDRLMSWTLRAHRGRPARSMDKTEPRGLAAAGSRPAVADPLRRKAASAW